MAQVQARKDRIVTGLTKGVEFLFKKNKIDWIKGTARLAGNGGVEVFEGETQTLRARKEIIVATGSAPRSVPGIEIDRKRIITSDEAIDLREVPKSMRHPGQRRRRRRVRVDLPPLRQRRHDHRAAAAARAGRGRGGVGGAREVVPQAGHHEPHRREGDGGAGRAATAWTSTSQLADGSTKTIRADYLLVATGRGPVTDGPRRGGRRPAAREGLHQGRRAVPDERARASRRSATSSRWAARASAARAPVVGGRHRRRRADRRARTSGRSTTTTCPAAPTAIRKSAASA